MQIILYSSEKKQSIIIYNIRSQFSPQKMKRNDIKPVPSNNKRYIIVTEPFEVEVLWVGIFRFTLVFQIVKVTVWKKSSVRNQSVIWRYEKAITWLGFHLAEINNSHFGRKGGLWRYDLWNFNGVTCPNIFLPFSFVRFDFSWVEEYSWDVGLIEERFQYHILVPIDFWSLVFVLKILTIKCWEKFASYLKRSVF